MKYSDGREDNNVKDSAMVRKIFEVVPEELTTKPLKAQGRHSTTFACVYFLNYYNKVGSVIF